MMKEKSKVTVLCEAVDAVLKMKDEAEKDECYALNQGYHECKMDETFVALRKALIDVEWGI